MQKTARPQTCFCPRIHEAISEEKPSPVLTQISTEPQNHRFESQLPFSPASLGNPNHSPQPDPKAAPIRPQFFLAFQVLRRASGVAPRSAGEKIGRPPVVSIKMESCPLIKGIYANVVICPASFVWVNHTIAIPFHRPTLMAWGYQIFAASSQGVRCSAHLP